MIKRPRITQETREKIAVLVSDNCPSKQVALDLGISESAVSKIVKEISDPDDPERLLDRTPRLLNIDERKANELRKHIYDSSKFKEKLKSACPHNRLVDVAVFNKPAYNNKATEQENLAAERATFLESAALYLLREVIPQSNLIALTFGYTVAGVVSQFEKHAKNITRTSGQFIQVAGDAKFTLPRFTRASELVTRSNKAVYESESSDYTFSFPANLPRKLPLKEIRAIRKFMIQDNGYSRVFDLSKDSDLPKLMPIVDVFITSCGTTDSKSDNNLWATETADQLSEDDKRDFSEHIVGNIGGVWIPKETERAKEIAANMNLYWNGVSTEDIEHLSKAKEVVLLIDTAEKGKVGYELIKRGLVNRLLTSESGKEAMESCIG